MKRRERTRILVEGNPAVLERIATEAVQAFGAETVKEPCEELVMLKMRETSQRSLFYLGEALMTTCCVRMQEALGYGMAFGESHSKAYRLAVVDAAYASNSAECEARGWTALIAEEGVRLEEKQQSQREALLKTQVDFSTMEVDDDCK